MTNPLQQFTADHPGWELVHRTCIVRLGPDMEILTDGNHASIGVLSVSSTTDDLLKVTTDFASNELCLVAMANPDAQLVAKGVDAGASGGASITYFDIRSRKTLTYGSSGQYSRAAGTRLPPESGVFSSTTDNLWLTFLSLRPVA